MMVMPRFQIPRAAVIALIIFLAAAAVAVVVILILRQKKNRQGGQNPPYPPRKGYQPPQGYPSGQGFPQQPGYPSQPGFTPPQGYQTGQGFTPQQGYPSGQGFTPQQEYSSQSGFTPQQGYPSGQGFAPQQEYPSQSGYAQQQGYQAQPGYAQQQGYQAQPGYAQQQAYQAQTGFPRQSGYPSQPGTAYEPPVQEGQDPRREEDTGAPRKEPVSQDTRAYDMYGTNWQNQSTDSQPQSPWARSEEGAAPASPAGEEAASAGEEAVPAHPSGEEPFRGQAADADEDRSPSDHLLEHLAGNGDLLQDDVTVQMFDGRPVGNVRPQPAGAVHLVDMPAERWEIYPGGHLTIGRRTVGCDAVISGDPMISGSHLRIHAVGNEYLEVEDLNSTNGTLVNGRRITTPVVIRSGDMIRIGATDLVVE